MLRFILIVLIGLAIYKCAKAETYRYKNGLIVNAKNFREAGHKCFWTLTGGVYPGEEKGLDIIDICANGNKVTKWNSVL